MATTRHIVVVATAESSLSEELAEKLRSEFTVRTAYDRQSVDESLDETVDVVLVAPTLHGVDPDTFARHLRDRDVVCQLGLLTDGPRTDVPEGVDMVLEKTTPKPELERVVARMAARATYRQHLERLYDLSTRRAEILGTDPDARTERESAELAELDGHIEQLRSEIVDALGRLDDQAAFEAALQFIDDPEDDGDSDVDDR